MLRGKFTGQVDAVQFRFKDVDEIDDWLNMLVGFDVSEDDKTIAIYGDIVHEGDWLVTICGRKEVSIFTDKEFRERFAPVKEE